MRSRGGKIPFIKKKRKKTPLKQVEKKKVKITQLKMGCVMLRYVALFFAFEGADDPTWVDSNTGELNNYSRTIFILNKAFIQDLVDDEGAPQAGEQLQIVEPSIDDTINSSYKI